MPKIVRFVPLSVPFIQWDGTNETEVETVLNAGSAGITSCLVINGQLVIEYTPFPGGEQAINVNENDHVGMSQGTSLVTLSASQLADGSLLVVPQE